MAPDAHQRLHLSCLVEDIFSVRHHLYYHNPPAVNYQLDYLEDEEDEEAIIVGRRKRKRNIQSQTFQRRFVLTAVDHSLGERSGKDAGMK